MSTPLESFQPLHQGSSTPSVSPSPHRSSDPVDQSIARLSQDQLSWHRETSPFASGGSKRVYKGSPSSPTTPIQPGSLTSPVSPSPVSPLFSPTTRISTYPTPESPIEPTVAISMQTCKEKGRDPLAMEIAIMKKFHDFRIPGVIQILDAGIIDNESFCVTELCDGGNLDMWIPTANATKKKEVITQIALTVSEMHGHDIVHRDIKPLNILMKEGKPRLADFGCAIDLNDEACKNADRGMGTFIYKPPGAAVKDYKKHDVFSLGSTIFEIVTGKKLAMQILAKKPSGGTLGFQYLVQTKPEDIALTIEEFIKDPLLKDLLKGMLDCNETTRFEMQQVLAHPYFN